MWRAITLGGVGGGEHFLLAC